MRLRRVPALAKHIDECQLTVLVKWHLEGPFIIKVEMVTITMRCPVSITRKSGAIVRNRKRLIV